MAFNINPDISKASNLSTEFYLDPKYFSLCKENIFSKSWQLIADTTTLLRNNIYPITFLENFINEPLVLLKNEEEIKCFSNVCSHRAHLVSTKPCHNNKLRCKYHGRTFNLDGTMHSMPGFEGACNFPTEKDDLESIPLIIWKKFILASINPNIDIMPAFQDIKNRLPRFPFDNLTYNENDSQSWEIDAHWALYCENYLEGFHVPYIHKGLINEINNKTYETILLENSVLQIVSGNIYCELLENPNKPKQNLYGLYYWIFPNLMLNFYSWGLSINIIEPISKDRTKIRFLSYPIKNKQQPSVGDAKLSNVEKEDQKVVLNVQKGIESRYYNSGRYSPLCEKGLHHFHLLISKYIS